MTVLVIFDCDGVLVDSEAISIDVERQLLSQLGVNISTEELIDQFVGLSVQSMKTKLETDYQLSLPDDYLENGQREVIRRFDRELAPVAGIAEALDHISQHRCVASSSLPERIKHSLTLTGIIDRFEHFFSASMVARGKPNPDLFLHAAKTLGTAPKDCIVIEDSTAGVQAAKAAGMTVFAFSGASHANNPRYRAKLDALQPDRHFTDMTELPKLLALHQSQRRT